MSKSHRLTLLLATASFISIAGEPALAQQTTSTSSSAGAPQNATVTKPNVPWAKDSSDLPVDRSVRYGVLPNGMKYAIMHNETPPKKASLRLHIAAGSLMEKDDQLGLAHFMEHMAFNGTTNIPKNELINQLERLGLAFGADLNAATSFDQTFYILELPQNDAVTIDTALNILREQASEATMDPSAIDDERGVIAGEERLRNVPSQRLNDRMLSLYGKGQKFASRSPIGDLRIISTAKRDRFVDFYRSYYRPSRATVIAVGDFDVDEMEKKIKARFGDWTPVGPDGPDPDLGKIANRSHEVNVIVEAGAPSAASLVWIQEPDLSPDTVAKRRAEIVNQLGTAAMNRRLNEIANGDNPPFVSASIGDSDLLRSLRLATISASFVQGRSKEAVAAIEREQRRFLHYGITKAQLDREINTARNRLKSAVASAATRNTSGLANRLMSSVNDRTVLFTPQTELDLFEDVVKTITPDSVMAEVRKRFTGQGPILTVVSPKPIEGGEGAVAAAYDAAHREQLAAPTPLVKMPWPYTDFGKPGLVVSRESIPEFDATRVVFANGTTLLVKKTNFETDSVVT